MMGGMDLISTGNTPPPVLEHRPPHGGHAGVPLRLAGWLFGVLLICRPPLAFTDRLPAALQTFSGAPARLVWIQQVDGNGDDPFCWERRHVLMALDTEDPGGERVLLDRVDNYHRPILSPSGSQVIFSQHTSRRYYRIQWDGTGLEELGEGYALALWRDPETQVKWVYYTVTGHDEWEKHHGSVVYRRPLDEPGPVEKIWDRTVITIDNFQLSADGTQACAQFPHPRAGIANLVRHRWMPLSRGCWTSMAPDNSYWTWVFDGRHRNVTIHDPVNDRAWMVDIHSAPGMDGYEVYHPRWSNHRRFFVITGPYKTGRMGQNLITAGGPEIEVYVGRFSPDYQRVEAWLQITSNHRGDFYPDLWISPSPDRAVAAAATSRDVLPTDRWPRVRDSIGFVWDHAGQPDELDGPDGASIPHGPIEGSGRAFWGRHQDMWLAGGRFASAAERRPDPSGAASDAGMTFEAVLTPHADLSGQDALIWGAVDDEQTPRWAWVQTQNQLRIVWPSAHGPQTSLPVLALTPGQPHHVIVTLSPDPPRIESWLNGSRLVRLPLDAPPEWPPDEEPLPLLFGGGRPADSSWFGQIEAVAIYSRTLNAGEIQAHATLQRERLGRREAIPSAVVDARLLEAPPPPEPSSIAPYRRALSGHRYALESVLSGTFPDNEFVVAEWSILDAAQVEPRHPIGEIVRMRLEPFESHPQMESERLLIDTDLMLLPLFINASAHQPP